jgi:putative membrane protein
MMVFALLHPFSQFSWLKWSIHPSTVIGLAALAALYIWRARSATSENTLSGWRKLSFFSALLVIFGSLNGPIHDLSDGYLFSAHMVQHLLITMLMPPLMIIGVPGWMLRPLLRNRVINAIARRLTKPVACFVIALSFHWFRSCCCDAKLARGTNAVGVTSVAGLRWTR